MAKIYCMKCRRRLRSRWKIYHISGKSACGKCFREVGPNWVGASAVAPLSAICCPRCNHLVVANATFCGRCGGQIDTTEPPASHASTVHAMLSVIVFLVLVVIALIVYAIAR